MPSLTVQETRRTAASVLQRVVGRRWIDRVEPVEVLR
jgi:hypothetical protein